MIGSQVRLLLLAVVFCAIGIAALMGSASQTTPAPATRPAPPAADFAAWQAELPASAELPDTLRLPGDLLTEARRLYRAGRADRRERGAVLTVHPNTKRVRLMGERTGGYHSLAAAADPTPGDSRRAVGDFHTHPALGDDPRHIQGFSPADLRAFLARGAKQKRKVALLADAGKLWMIVRTQMTLAAWPTMQTALERPRFAALLTAAASRAETFKVAPEQRDRWVSFHTGLSFNIRIARTRRLLSVYFDPAGRRHENVFLGGYALYVGNLADGILERCDQ